MAARNDPHRPEFGTLPEASKRFGIGLKRLRARARDGCFPVYTGDTAWFRVKFAEVEAWLRSTRVEMPAGAEAHARAVVEKRRALEAEGRPAA